MKPSTPWTLDRIFRLFLVIAAIAITLWMVSSLSAVLIPFGLAFLIAYIINPAVDRVQKVVRSRFVAVTLTLLVSTILLCTALYFLISPVSSQMKHAGTLISRSISDTDFSNAIQSRVPPALWNVIRTQLDQDHVTALFQNQETLKVIGQVLAKIAPNAVFLLSGTLSLVIWLFGLTMVFLYLFFMLLDFEGLRHEITELIPVHYRETTFSFLHEFDMAMSTYFRAQALISLILGAVFALGFTLIGLPLAIPIGFVAGFMTMVPYLQLTSIPVALLLALLQAVDSGSSVWVSFGLVGVVYAVGQFSQDVILVPRIVGNSTGLSPVMIMLSLSVWGSFLGFFGMIIAVPFTCLVFTYYRRLLKKNHETEST